MSKTTVAAGAVAVAPMNCCQMALKLLLQSLSSIGSGLAGADNIYNFQNLLNKETTSTGKGNDHQTIGQTSA